MSEPQVVNFNLKAVINKQKTKVLYAEIDNDFADVLFSFLILPVGDIMHAMKKHYGEKTPHGIGSLNSLCNSLFNLKWFTFSSGMKPAIVNPQSVYAFPFVNQKLTIHSSDQPEVCVLGEAYFVVLRVFTEKNASFIICDNDLRIVPKGNGSDEQTLNSVGIEYSDIDGAETRNVTFGLNQIMDFLKGLLTSHQPLTDIILGCTTRISLHQIEKKLTSVSNSNKIHDLKVTFQKSTKKLLFAKADKEFVSCLSNILTIPLGMVDFLFGGNTCFNKIDNLYRSIADLVDNKYLNCTDIKDHLMKIETFSTPIWITQFVTNQFDQFYGSRMYMVVDDLTVTYFCVSSADSLLREMRICSSDVEEVELHIRSEEILNVLKASLASTSALSNGLSFL